MAAPELEIGDGALGFWAALREIMKSDSREAAQEEIRSFREEYGAKYPKVVDTLSGSQDKLLTFFDSRPSTGSTSGPATRSSRPSRR
jgi:transposase-like protein